MAFRFIPIMAALFFMGWPSVAWDQTIRFCPGPEAPIAFDSATGDYEEGASFDPLLCAEEPCIQILGNLFEPLVSVSDTQIIEPHLSTGWERRDEVTFRFTLRRGVTFHNGEPFDAEAVRFSLMRASQAYGATAWFPEIAEVDIIGPFTVDVVLREPDSLFLYQLAYIGLIQPPRYFRQVGLDKFGKTPVGTGPFQFVRWDGKRREIHLEANPHYWRKGYPKVERVIYSYLDSKNALDLLTQGKLDLIRRLNPRKTTEFMQTGKGKIVKAWLPQIVLGTFNLLKNETPLKDFRVRQAINLAINREDLIRYGAIGNGRLLRGYTVPEDPNHAGLRPYPLDVPKAKQLLREAGYAKGFKLSMSVDDKLPPQIENIIAVSLRQIGITVGFKRVSMSEFLKEHHLAKLAGASPSSFDIQLAVMPAGTIFHSGNVAMTWLYSKKPNQSLLRDPVLDQLYEEALRTYDPAKASAVWKKLERYVYDNHLLLIGYQQPAVFGANKGLHFTPRSLISFWDAYYER